MTALELFDEYIRQRTKLLPDPKVVNAAQSAARREIEWLMRNLDTAVRDFNLLKDDLKRPVEALVRLRGDVYPEIKALEAGDAPADVAKRLRIALDGESE